jgi:hypothetical protein
MVAELNEIWGETTKTSECDKIMEHIKNCPECQQKLKFAERISTRKCEAFPKLKAKQQVVEKFQNQPVQKVQRVQPSEDLVEKFFEYSDVILIGLTIYLVLKAL